VTKYRPPGLRTRAAESVLRIRNPPIDEESLLRPVPDEVALFEPPDRDPEEELVARELAGHGAAELPLHDASGDLVVLDRADLEGVPSRPHQMLPAESKQMIR